MTRLVVLDPERFIPTGLIKPLDIDTGFLSTDVISVALPAFPLPSITTAQSFIDFTSNPDGFFDVGPTDSIAFSQTTVPLINGDSELRFPRSLLTTIDKTAVTGVKFRIEATNTCNFQVMSIRLLSADWTLAPLDMNTLYNRTVRPVSLTGTPGAAMTFPTSALTPGDYPILWRSAEPTGPLDPTPVNVDMGASFYSGSLTETTTADPNPTQNSISLYFRERLTSYLTQLDLDATYTMATLDALGRQPDYGTSGLEPREQSTLDTLTQADMNFLPQTDLEGQPDTTNNSWLRVKLAWSVDDASIDIRDTENNGYTFGDLILDANQHYYWRIELEDDKLRVRLYKMDHLGNIDLASLAFDSGTIKDDAVAIRRQGRFGWYANLLDGDAYISNIRPRGTSFAEYRSAPFQSITPVDGASLFVGGTINHELYDGINASYWGGTIELDPNKSVTGKAIKVSALDNKPLQGVMTNELEFDDFEETTIDLNIWFPKVAVDAGARLEAFLLGENIRLVPLHVGITKTDQWSSLHFNLTEGRDIQPGRYRLVLLQTVASIPTIWWLDQISIRTRVTKWSARPHQGGAWGFTDPGWTPFRDTVNKIHGGVIFAERGNSLQIRGEARRQGARIQTIKATPKYVELGRFVWAEDKAAQIYGMPTVSFTTTTSGTTVTVDGGASTGAILYQWDFGDGARDFGVTSSNTYLPGSYPITLTIVDAQGQRISSTQTVTIT